MLPEAIKNKKVYFIATKSCLLPEKSKDDVFLRDISILYTDINTLTDFSLSSSDNFYYYFRIADIFRKKYPKYKKGLFTSYNQISIDLNNIFSQIQDGSVIFFNSIYDYEWFREYIKYFNKSYIFFANHIISMFEENLDKGKDSKRINIYNVKKIRNIIKKFFNGGVSK